MSPSIRVDEEVYGLLQRNAQPFVDTPNTVLRRLLKLADKAANEEAVERPKTEKGARKRARVGTSRRSTRARTGTILPHETYVAPILITISEAGGSAPTRQVIEEVGRRLERQFTAADLEHLPSGMVRWENRAQFVRLRLVEQGLLAGDSPRGIWTLTPAGTARAGNGV